MNHKIKRYLPLLLLIGWVACQQEDTKVIPDVSDITVDLTIDRFEEALFSLDTSQLEAGLAQLEQQYPAFSEVYFNFVLGSKDPKVAPQGHIEYVKGFLTHPGLVHLYDTTHQLLPIVWHVPYRRRYILFDLLNFLFHILA